MSNFIKDMREVFVYLVKPDFKDEAVEVYHKIIHHYTEPHRYYHDIFHLEDLFTLLRQLTLSQKEFDEAFLTMLYHDIIYNPGSNMNELLSKKHFLKDSYLFDLKNSSIFDIANSIQKTTYSKGCSTDLFGDLDLAGLGFKYEIYQEKGKLIRQEFSRFSDEQFKEGRLKFLKLFLGSSRIFSTEGFYNKYETKARENMLRELHSYQLQ